MESGVLRSASAARVRLRGWAPIPDPLNGAENDRGPRRSILSVLWRDYLLLRWIGWAKGIFSWFSVSKLSNDVRWELEVFPTLASHLVRGDKRIAISPPSLVIVHNRASPSSSSKPIIDYDDMYAERHGLKQAWFSRIGWSSGSTHDLVSDGNPEGTWGSVVWPVDLSQLAESEIAQGRSVLLKYGMDPQSEETGFILD